MSRTKITITISLTATLLLLSSQTFAGGSRLLCGNERISKGDTMHEVRLDCGAPLSELEVGESVITSKYLDQHRRIEERRNVTEWVYEKGNFIYTLVFKGSELASTKSKRK